MIKNMNLSLIDETGTRINKVEIKIPLIKTKESKEIREIKDERDDSSSLVRFKKLISRNKAVNDISTHGVDKKRNPNVGLHDINNNTHAYNNVSYNNTHIQSYNTMNKSLNAKKGIKMRFINHSVIGKDLSLNVNTTYNNDNNNSPINKKKAFILRYKNSKEIKDSKKKLNLTNDNYNAKKEAKSLLNDTSSNLKLGKQIKLKNFKMVNLTNMIQNHQNNDNNQYFNLLKNRKNLLTEENLVNNMPRPFSAASKKLNESSFKEKENHLNIVNLNNQFKELKDDLLEKDANAIDIINSYKEKTRNLHQNILINRFNKNNNNYLSKTLNTLKKKIITKNITIINNNINFNTSIHNDKIDSSMISPTELDKTAIFSRNIDIDNFEYNLTESNEDGNKLTFKESPKIEDSTDFANLVREESKKQQTLKDAINNTNTNNQVINKVNTDSKKLDNFTFRREINENKKDVGISKDKISFNTIKSLKLHIKNKGVNSAPFKFHQKLFAINTDKQDPIKAVFKNSEKIENYKKTESLKLESTHNDNNFISLTSTNNPTLPELFLSDISQYLASESPMVQTETNRKNTNETKKSINQSPKLMKRHPELKKFFD